MDKEFPSKITAIGTDDTGNNVVIAMVDGTISTVSAQNLIPNSTIFVNDSLPHSASFSSPQQNGEPILAVGFSDGTVRLYQYGKEIHRFSSQKNAILSVSFHPTKLILAAACLDGTFSIYKYQTPNSNEAPSWQTMTIDASHMGLTAVAWGSDLGSDSQFTLIVGGADGVVRVFKTTGSGWEQTCAAQVHNGWIRYLSTPTVPLGSVQKIASCGDNSEAAVIKVCNNEVTVTQIQPFSTPVSGASWAMVDKVLVLSHINGTISMWSENKDGEWSLSKEYL